MQLFCKVALIVCIVFSWMPGLFTCGENNKTTADKDGNN